MKAIVLSFDDQLGFVELLHKCYRELWPGCPLTFLVPYQDQTVLARHHYLASQPEIEFRPTEKPIHLTMQALLEGCDDNEWVYWCIDDRYPYAVHDLDSLRAVHQAVVSGDLDDRPGIKLARWREVPRTWRRRIGNYDFHDQSQAGMWGFWHHHFLRASILRAVFVDNDLPRPLHIRDLNSHFHEVRPLSVIDEILLPSENIIDFAEPCWLGKLTRNGAEDLARHGCPLPDYERLENIRVFHKAWRSQVLERTRTQR
ncbi:MAG: hypothetical protein MI865_01230 [Proteobacteria bacterium]|nr:hypothetical protein [Pseudomonadota bacterium]